MFFPKKLSTLHPGKRNRYMPNLKKVKRFIGASIFLFCLAGIVLAQSPNEIETSSTIICANEEISFSINNSSAKNPQWDFGDGKTSTEKNPVHRYEIAGTYIVKFTSENSVYKIIEVSDVSSAEFYIKDTTHAEINRETEFIARDKTASSYAWDFGDGNTAEGNGIDFARIKHAYSALGNYTVTLATSNFLGCRSVVKKENFIYVVATQKSRLDFSASVVKGCNSLYVVFKNTSSNASGFHWDFGDSSFSDEPSPSHLYAKPENYSVTLTAETFEGDFLYSKKKNFIIIVAPPFADFSVENSELTMVDAEIVITNRSRNAENFIWDFGDGTISSQENPNHTYKEPGTYYVKLTAISDNTCSQTSERTEKITVTQNSVMSEDMFYKNQVVLLQNSPNPFRASTTIKYYLPQTAKVKLAVYDVRGVEVSVLADENQDDGVYVYSFGEQNSSCHISNGVYFCKLSVEGKVFVIKMLMNSYSE